MSVRALTERRALAEREDTNGHRRPSVPPCCARAPIPPHCQHRSRCERDKSDIRTASDGGSSVTQGEVYGGQNRGGQANHQYPSSGDGDLECLAPPSSPTTSRCLGRRRSGRWRSGRAPCWSGSIRARWRLLIAGGFQVTLAELAATSGLIPLLGDTLEGVMLGSWPKLAAPRRNRPETRPSAVCCAERHYCALSDRTPGRLRSKEWRRGASRGKLARDFGQTIRYRRPGTRTHPSGRAGVNVRGIADEPPGQMGWAFAQQTPACRC